MTHVFVYIVMAYLCLSFHYYMCVQSLVRAARRPPQGRAQDHLVAGAARQRALREDMAGRPRAARARAGRKRRGVPVHALRRPEQLSGGNGSLEEEREGEENREWTSIECSERLKNDFFVLHSRCRTYVLGFLLPFLLRLLLLSCTAALRRSPTSVGGLLIGR